VFVALKVFPEMRTRRSPSGASEPARQVEVLTDLKGALGSPSADGLKGALASQALTGSATGGGISPEFP